MSLLNVIVFKWVLLVHSATLYMLHTAHLIEGPIQHHEDQFENTGFTLKTQEMFSVHTTLEKFENATITGHFGFVFDENAVRKSSNCCDVIVFEKHSSQNVFSPHENSNPTFSNFSGLKGVFETFHLRNWLVWTVGRLTVKLKLGLHNFLRGSVQCGERPTIYR